MDSNRYKTLRVVGSVEHLQQLKKDSILDTLVNVDKLLPEWKPRSFQIRVPVSVVLTDLLHSIFDWSLIQELMSNDQIIASHILQKKVNDFELLHKLINTMQRIQLSDKPENNFNVKLIIRRPSFDMEILDDGTIMVNRLPSLLIEVVAHDHQMTDDKKAIAFVNFIDKLSVRKRNLGYVGQHIIQTNINEFEYEYDNGIEYMHQMETTFSSRSTELFTIEEIDEPSETDDNEEEVPLKQYAIIPSLAKLSKIQDIEQTEISEKTNIYDNKQSLPILEKQLAKKTLHHQRRRNFSTWNCFNYWIRRAIYQFTRTR